MKVLHRLIWPCLAAGFAMSAAAADAHPALYSFNDLYRLAVNGPQPVIEPQPVRVAAASEVRFTITPVPGPKPWMLLLAGLAAAAWVAHRRLTRPL